jgi:hypothetical protein
VPKVERLIGVAAVEAQQLEELMAPVRTAKLMVLAAVVVSATQRLFPVAMVLVELLSLNSMDK